ncbi:MAG: hypothetical protein Tsb0015_03630 [Simkaniaceae bacterium]
MHEEFRFSASFPAELPYLHTILTWFRERLAKVDLDLAEIKKIELAIEEAIVNIVHYAYLDKPGKIELFFQNLKDEIEIEIKDFGVAFNPLENIQPIDKSLSLEERDIGGLGLPLIEIIMDELQYFREDDANRLVLRKNIKR